MARMKAAKSSSTRHGIDETFIGRGNEKRGEIKTRASKNIAEFLKAELDIGWNKSELWSRSRMARNYYIRMKVKRAGNFCVPRPV